MNTTLLNLILIVGYSKVCPHKKDKEEQPREETTPVVQILENSESQERKNEEETNSDSLNIDLESKPSEIDRNPPADKDEPVKSNEKFTAMTALWNTYNQEMQPAVMKTFQEIKKTKQCSDRKLLLDDLKSKTLASIESLWNLNDDNDYQIE